MTKKNVYILYHRINQIIVQKILRAINYILMYTKYNDKQPNT